jgi:hypothetical protein
MELTNLRNKEPGEDEAASAGGAPDEEDFGFKTSRASLLVHKEWC